MCENSKNEDVYEEDGLDFRSEFLILLNKYNRENISNTPDFVLRDYLCDCLKAFDKATNSRSKWYGNLGRNKNFREEILP